MQGLVLIFRSVLSSMDFMDCHFCPSGHFPFMRRGVAYGEKW